MLQSIYLDFSKILNSFFYVILLEKFAAHGLGRWTLYCLRHCIRNCLNGQAQSMAVNGGASIWSLVGFPRAQCWYQCSLIS